MDIRVTGRITARRHAEEIWNILIEETPTDAKAYWDRIKELASQALGLTQPVKPINPFNEKRCTWFEGLTVPFGIHKGERVRNVPLSYLCNLADPSEFIYNLQCYLRNPRIRKRIEDET